MSTEEIINIKAMTRKDTSNSSFFLFNTLIRLVKEESYLDILNIRNNLNILNDLRYMRLNEMIMGR